MPAPEGVTRFAAGLLTGLLLLCASGAEDRVPGGPILAIENAFDGSWFVYHAAGDLDGDGTPDRYVAEPLRADGGRLFARSGKDDSLIRTLAGPGGYADFFGVAVTLVGDLDGRGCPDVLVGAPSGTIEVTDGRNYAYARVFAGEDGAVLFDSGWKVPGSCYGRRVVALPDIDEDGVPDFAVGEGVYRPWQFHVYSGRTGTLIHRVRGPDEEAETGLVPVADVDRDGVPDVAFGIGGPSPPQGEEGPGEIRILSGATFEEIRSIPGEWGPYDFGQDLLPGVGPGLAGRFFRARATHERSGDTTTFVIDALTGLVVGEIRPSRADGGQSGITASIGDQDGDGFPERVELTQATWSGYGEPADSPPLLRVLSSRTGLALFTLLGWPGENLGMSFPPHADWDGDGREDLVLDSVYSLTVGRYETRVYRVDTAPGRAVVRVDLQRHPGAVDRPLRASLAVGFASGRSPLALTVTDPGWGVDAIAWLEEGPGAGRFVPVGDLVPAGSSAGRLVLDTGTREVPAAIRRAALAELAGRRFLIGDPASPALEGTIPSPVAEDFEGRATLLPPPGSPAPEAEGRVEVRTSAARGTTRISLRSRGLPEGLDPVLWVEDDAGSGTLSPAGTLRRGRLVLTTSRGDPLPGFAADGAALSGRRIEVREGAVVLLRGTLP